MAVLKANSVAAALAQYQGNMAAAARALGVSRAAVWKFVQAHPKLKEVVIDLREGMKDNAESSLYKAVLDGESWAVCFYLKTQAKDRGYVEKSEHEHTGKDGGAIEHVVIYVPDDGRNPAAAEAGTSAPQQG